MKRTVSAITAASLLMMTQLNAQDIDPNRAPVNPASVLPFDQRQISGGTRFIALTELGYDRGLEMPGLSGTRDLYFALPPASDIQAMRLRLPYRSDTAFESQRSLVIEIDGQTLHTMALPSSASEGVIDLPVDPSLVRDGFLAVRIRYRGAITEARCIDQRLSGAFFSLSKDAGLLVDYGPQAFASVANFAQAMPTAVNISLPDAPSQEQAAAAMTLAAGNSAARIGGLATPQSTDGIWRTTDISIVGANEPALAIIRTGANPQLRIGGVDPAATSRLLLSRWRALSASAVVASAQLSNKTRMSDRLTFTDLGGDTSIQSVVDRGSWTVPLPSRDLPAGQAASRLVIEASVSDDGGNIAPVINVMMNGVLLDSAIVTDPKLTRLDVAIPQGLASTQNVVEVAVTRQVASDDCFDTPQGYDAQLLPSSHVQLADAGPVADFSDLSSSFNAGYTIVVPDASTLGSLARILEPLASSFAPVSVSFSGMPETGAVVVVSDTPPAGTEPALRFDQGLVELAVEGGRSLLDSDALARTTIVQILEQGGRPILWIKPGDDFAQLAANAQSLVLAHGDVAVLSADRIEIAFSTTRDRLIDIRYPQQVSFGQLLNRYRLWLIGFGWIVISMGFIYLLRRIYLARRAD